MRTSKLPNRQTWSGVSLVLTVLAGALTPAAQAHEANAPKPASQHTASLNAQVARSLQLNDAQDFQDAERGLVAKLPLSKIVTPTGQVVWDTERFGFIKDQAPATVNPSLWRQERLNNVAGLFRVTDGIYQIRGYDLANMTLVEGQTGWIVIDPLLTAEISKATLAFAMQALGSSKPVVAVIYTHGHADHFGGVRGVVQEADVAAGKVQVIAPEGLEQFH